MSSGYSQSNADSGSCLYSAFTPPRGLPGIAVVAIAASLLAGCGGKAATPIHENSAAAILATQPSGMEPLPAATDDEILLARLEFSRLDVPDGMDASNWQQLGDALIDSLQTRAASKLPDESRNVVDDLEWIDKGGGDFSLEWTLHNAGDYDNNGEVNVSDLSAIGVHFGKNESSSDWDKARTADGDGNGEINIADVSPIGVNFGSQVLGYNVYASDYEDGPWLLQGSIPLEDATTGFPRMFSYAYGTQEHAYVTVSPFDTSGSDIVAASGGTSAKYIPGESTMGDSAIVDNETVAVIEGGAGTPIEGVSVSIPVGAIAAPTEISLGYNDGTVLPVAGEWSGVIVEVSEEPLLFNSPIEITVPYSGNPDVYPVPYFLNNNNQLEACMVKETNSAEGTMTFISLHASRFTWIISESLPSKVNLSFSPSKDGFQIANWGSLYENGGECLGMSSFAAWYFGRKQAGEITQNLYPRFMYSLGKDYVRDKDGVVHDVDLTGQDAIATRAHSSLNAFWYKFGAVYARNPSSYLEILHQICNTMSNTNMPTPLYLTYSGLDPSLLTTGDHCVLAYGYEDGKIAIYDPNTPPYPEEITYNGATFDYYQEKYNSVYHLGMGSAMKEDFQSILEDAEQQFTGNLIAEITELNYSDGEVVVEPHIVLQGTVQSSQLLVEKIKIDTGLLLIEKEVNTETGKWSARVPLQNGDNFLKLITEARNQSGSWYTIPNNYDLNHGLHLECQAPPTKLRISLTWDEKIPFFMEVTDPNGDIASDTGGAQWELTPTTPDGGLIDGSNHNGGPLYFIIPEDGTLRSGEYKVRVLNYSSSFLHEVEAANWTVAVSINDGPPRYYSGRLNEGSQTYVDPDDFGPYWSKYIRITP